MKVMDGDKLPLPVVDLIGEFVGVCDEVRDLRQEVGQQKELRRKEINGYGELQRHRDHWRGYAYGSRNRPADFLGVKIGSEPTRIDRLLEAITTALGHLDVPSVELDDGVLFANRVLRKALEPKP